MQTFFENRTLIGTPQTRLALLLLLPCLSVLSCQSNQPTSGPGDMPSDMADEGKALFGTTSPDHADEAWSIIIVSYTITPDTTLQEVRSLARRDLDRVREVGLTDAYVQMRGERLVLAMGNYATPDDPQALADLDRVKSFEWEGLRPFAGALLTPPAKIDAGNYPQYNLANVKQQFGEDAIYSLLYATYGHPDKRRPTAAERKQFRNAAEEGTVALRREGEQAFYYHGPHSSSITIGVFGHDDYRIEIDANGRRKTIRSKRLNALQARYPTMLLNGQTIRLSALSQGKNEVLQRTDLISIP
jgi:hypothetical protein